MSLLCSGPAIPFHTLSHRVESIGAPESPCFMTRRLTFEFQSLIMKLKVKRIAPPSRSTPSRGHRRRRGEKIKNEAFCHSLQNNLHSPSPPPPTTPLGLLGLLLNTISLFLLSSCSPSHSQGPDQGRRRNPKDSSPVLTHQTCEKGSWVPPTCGFLFLVSRLVSYCLASLSLFPLLLVIFQACEFFLTRHISDNRKFVVSLPRPLISSANHKHNCYFL